MMSLSIVFYGADICTGSCGYCTGAIGLPALSQGTGKDVLKSIEAIDRRLYDLIQFDFDALEETLVERTKGQSKVNFSIWGGDPLASFMSYQDLYDFLHYFGEKYNIEITLSGSTNGLAFLDKDKTDWILKHNDIRMQLSHDGLGQWIRTKDIDPLKIDGVDELFKAGRLRNINCNLSILNASPLQNVEYFNQFNWLSNGIRLYTARDEKYYKAIPNPDGKFNNTSYESLKGSSIVDIQVRNDVELAKKYGIFQFGHQADLMFDEFYYMYENLDKFPKYKNLLLRRIGALITDYSKTRRPKCAQYHMGLIDWSNTIDTLGKYTVCHLYDSRMKQIANPELKHPDKCKGCPFINSAECNACGRTDLSDADCQLYYRLNQMGQHFKELYLQELSKTNAQKTNNIEKRKQ